MNCQTARRVWDEDSPIEGIRRHLPGVMERLEGFAARFAASDAEDPFDRQVKEIAGEGNYFVTHSEDNDPLAEAVHSVVGDAAMNVVLSRHFGAIYNQPIFFGNVCCSGCDVSDGSLDGDKLIAIQKAAISIR